MKGLIKTAYKIKNILFLFVFLFSLSVITGQSANQDFAEEEFRRGVQAFYRGSYNDAVLQFEKALTFLPEENLILDWLGKAYYKSGVEGAALQQWEYASNKGYGGLFLKNNIEIIRQRRTVDLEFSVNTRFVDSFSFPSSEEGITFFSQPLSILSVDDGSFWITAYGSNEVTRMNINGTIIQRVTGPINGFDRPMDIIQRKNGNLLISEYSGDRISELDSNGRYIKSFGQKGCGDGCFLGPQYMTLDDSDNLYITDFGNMRVSVFNSEGSYLFNFGKFKAPTGITYIDGLLYVADGIIGSILKYDTAGNYLGMLVPERTFNKPEALKPYKKQILVSDTNRVFAVDTEKGSVYETANIGNAPSHITCSIPDANGNILVSDYKSGDITVLSRITELAGGFFVDIEKVNADSFPFVTLEVKVENRRRQPVVGLQDINFLITEEKRPVSEQKFLGSVNVFDYCDLVLVIDRNLEMKEHIDALKSAILEIVSSMNGKGTVTIVSSGAIPAIEAVLKPNDIKTFVPDLIKMPYSKKCTTDLAVRLAANTLVSSTTKKAIVFITNTNTSNDSFSKYSLTDIAAYLCNNNIIFSVVNLKNIPVATEIEYLVTSTKGKAYYVYRTEGLNSIIKEIINIPVGTYTLSYKSTMETDFGRKFLPVEIEAYLLNRSGRSETGYFAPLQ